MMKKQFPILLEVALAGGMSVAAAEVAVFGHIDTSLDFQDTDGGMQALYELGLLKRRQWSQQDEANSELKKKLLVETRATLTSFISLYPDNFCAEQVKKNLSGLPSN